MSEVTFDRARLQQRVRDSARVAGRVALAVLKSAGHFLGACAVIAAFVYSGYFFLGEARKADAVLLHQAIEKAHDAARAAAAMHPSALEERDSALLMLSVAVCMIGAGVYWLVEWWKALPSIRKAAK